MKLLVAWLAAVVTALLAALAFAAQRDARNDQRTVGPYNLPRAKLQDRL